MTRRIPLQPTSPFVHSTYQVRARPRVSGRSGPLVLGATAVMGVQLVGLAAISDWSTVSRLVAAGVAIAGTIALIVGVRAPHRWVRGTAELTGGLLGTSIGIGLAPPWYATTGLSWVVVLGTASFIAGVALLVTGTWTLLRVTPGWWRLLAIPFAFLLVQFVLLPLAMAVYGTHPPHTPTTMAPPANAEEVSFVTNDGVRIEGWFTPSANGSAVILLPGSGGEKGSLVDHASVIARHGYGTLALDSRGTGTSGGVGNAWGWHGTADIEAALGWLAADRGIPAARVTLLGLSMGGEEALTAAAQLPGLAGVVAEGASARVVDDLVYLGSTVTGIIERTDSVLMWGLADLFTDAVPPAPLRDAVGQADTAGVPILLIVGNDPAEAGAAPLLEAVAPGMELWRLPDTPHIQALAWHPAEWEARVIAFLDAAH